MKSCLPHLFPQAHELASLRCLSVDPDNVGRNRRRSAGAGQVRAARRSAIAHHRTGLGAIGGFAAPDNAGYVDHLDLKPGGVTAYTSLPYLQGLDQQVNYGSGDICAQHILDNPIYADSVLAIGLYLVGQEKSIAGENRTRRSGRWRNGSRNPSARFSPNRF